MASLSIRCVFFTTGNDEVVGARLDGKILWVHSLGAEAVAAPTLTEVNGDGALDVVVGDETGHVHALDGRTGRVLWSRAFDPGAKIGDPIEAGVSAADLDGDGVNELVTASWSGTIRLSVRLRARLSGPCTTRLKYARRPCSLTSTAMSVPR